MALETVVRCDLCGEYIAKPDRRRLGIRRHEDRREDAEWVDACLPCRARPDALNALITVAEQRMAVLENGDQA